jgi:hypothetical protein
MKRDPTSSLGSSPLTRRHLSDSFRCLRSPREVRNSRVSSSGSGRGRRPRKEEDGRRRSTPIPFPPDPSTPKPQRSQLNFSLGSNPSGPPLSPSPSPSALGLLDLRMPPKAKGKAAPRPSAASKAAQPPLLDPSSIKQGSESSSASPAPPHILDSPQGEIVRLLPLLPFGLILRARELTPRPPFLRVPPSVSFCRPSFVL